MISSGLLSSDHIVEEIRKAQEREEHQKELEGRTASIAPVPREDSRKPMSELLHVRSLDNMTSRLKRNKDGRWVWAIYTSTFHVRRVLFKLDMRWTVTLWYTL